MNEFEAYDIDDVSALVRKYAQDVERAIWNKDCEAARESLAELKDCVNDMLTVIDEIEAGLPETTEDDTETVIDIDDQRWDKQHE